MAGYTYGKMSYTTYTTRSFKTHTCKHCGWKTPIMNDAEPPKLCQKCKHDPITGEEVDLTDFFHNEHGDDKVKLSTHVQVHWTCRACGHYGLKWIKSKRLSREGCVCSSCGGTNVSFKRVPKGGRSKSLWSSQPPRPTRPTRIVEKAFKCDECGNVDRFRFARPERCANCGQEYAVDHAEIPI